MPWEDGSRGEQKCLLWQRHQLWFAESLLLRSPPSSSSGRGKSSGSEYTQEPITLPLSWPPWHYGRHGACGGSLHIVSLPQLIIPKHRFSKTFRIVYLFPSHSSLGPQRAAAVTNTLLSLVPSSHLVSSHRAVIDCGGSNESL